MIRCFIAVVGRYLLQTARPMVPFVSITNRKTFFMKKWIQKFPVLSRFVLALLLGGAAIVTSGFVYGHTPIQRYFPFVDVLLLIGATWVLYRTDKQSLKTIGLNLSLRNTGFLFLGLLVGIVAVAGSHGLRSLYTGEAWHLGTAIDGIALLKSLYFVLPTAAVQELMFRGYPFTKAISKWGVTKTNILFAILFMLVHVVDRDVMQSIPRMIFLAVIIPVGHLYFATGLLRSGTLLLPIGLHWGNNWAEHHLFGEADNGQALIYTSTKVINTWPPFIILLLISTVFFLLVTWAIWKWRRPAVVSAPAIA
jgi:membrane protease YdiL (CAAX protease family)